MAVLRWIRQLLYWWDAVPTPRGRLSPGYNSRSGEPIESMEGSDS